jgi:hypothetical protein
MTVMTFLEYLRALSYTNHPQALADIKYDTVTIINIRVNILSNCEDNGQMASAYLAVHQKGMLFCRWIKPIKPDKLHRLTKVQVFVEGTAHNSFNSFSNSKVTAIQMHKYNCLGNYWECKLISWFSRQRRRERFMCKL